MEEKMRQIGVLLKYTIAEISHHDYAKALSGAGRAMAIVRDCVGEPIPKHNTRHQRRKRSRERRAQCE